MPITSIQRDQPNNVSIVRITCTDTLADIAAPNYILAQTPTIHLLNKGVWQWFNSDVLLFDSADGNAFFVFTDDTFSSLILLASSTDGTVSPGLMGQIAYYALSGTTVSGTNTLPATVQVNHLNLNNGINASGNTFWAGNDTFKTVASVTNHSIYTVYVAPDGSDVTGNGSINAPYQTITHALTTITTASSLTPYEIICLQGVYNETSIALKPFVNINGQDSVLVLSGTITADPLWSGGGRILFSNFSQITVGSPINVDVSSAGTNQCVLLFNNLEFPTSTDFNVIGSTNCIAGLFQLYSFSGSLNISVTNAFGALEQCSATNVNYVANDPAASYFYQLVETEVFGNLTVSSTAPSGVTFILKNTIVIGTITATGTNSALNLTVDSVTQSSIPILVGGATLSYFNVSNGLEANYTPVNYIPDGSGTTSPATSVAAHLHGIDNALGSAIGTVSQSRYVSVLGSDITGNGSLEKPWATIAFAMASITTASATNTFNVVLLDGVYTEAVQILLKPWVNLVGQSRNTIINNASDIILDSTTWNAALNGTMAIENLNIQNNLSLDFSALTADGPIVYINNIQTNNFLIDGNTVNPCIFFVRNSFFVNPSFNNSTVISFSNYYFTGFSCGTTAFTSGMNYFSNNDYYQSSVSLAAANAGPTSQFNIKNSTLNFTLSVSGALATLNIDTDSYVTPTLSGGAVLNLTSVSGGLGADYIPVNYMPTATPPTLSTSVQGHLRGIDNALGSKTLTWSEVLGTSQAADVNNAYITNNAGLVTVTLPATMSVGDRVAIQGKGAGGWNLTANTGQTIHVGNTASSVAGSAASTNQWDAIEVVCVTANTTWATRSMIGSLTIT